eukprot:3522520-Pyramimonas_sp.AAC.1
MHAHMLNLMHEAMRGHPPNPKRGRFDVFLNQLTYRPKPISALLAHLSRKPGYARYKPPWHSLVCPLSPGGSSTAEHMINNITIEEARANFL